MRRRFWNLRFRLGYWIGGFTSAKREKVTAAVPEVYVVVGRYTFVDKDENIAAYLVREPAEKHCDQLRDEDGVGDYAVWTIPLRHVPPEQ